MIHRLPFIRSEYDGLIVANGQTVQRALFRALRNRSSLVIALDGGLEQLRRWNVVPDHVIGDFDSVSVSALDWARKHNARIHRRPSQEEPDVAKGLDLCRRLGCSTAAVIGFAGSRVDHMLATLHFALKARKLSIELFTDEAVLFPLKGGVSCEFVVPAGHLVSWFGCPVAEHCTLAGVVWPFRNRTLRADGFHSLSNVPTAPTVQAIQRRGRSVFTISLAPIVRKGE
ncbi:thiamine diphosphokinase [bacterium]|nr:thiamine diphosphokinase [bacterium]